MKRALKSTGSSRTIGLGHKSSSSSLNLRRNNKKVDHDNEINFVKKKKKNKFKGPCEPLSSEPYVNIEIVKHGRDPNVSFSSGTVVKMACGKGYGLNLPENKTAKCVRGKWKPTKPVCSIRKYRNIFSKQRIYKAAISVPCYVPATPNGIFKLSRTEQLSQEAVNIAGSLNETVDVQNGQVVEFSCSGGYNVQGPSNMRCWHGEWTVTSLPECTAGI